MFELKREWGDHKIFSFNTSSNKFLEYFQGLFDTKRTGYASS